MATWDAAVHDGRGKGGAERGGEREGGREEGGGWWRRGEGWRRLGTRAVWYNYDPHVQALDGFLLVASSDGTIVYLSESIHHHLGIFQVRHLRVTPFPSYDGENSFPLSSSRPISLALASLYLHPYLLALAL
jgi:hypothetical protein